MGRINAETGGYRWRAEQRNADVVFPFFRIPTGNAVLSRFPIVSAELLELPQPDTILQWGSGIYNSRSPVQRRWAEETTGLRLKGLRHGARVRIALPGVGLIELWAIHLDSRHGVLREVAVECLLERVAQCELPVVVAGDFNTTVTADGAQRPLTALDRLLQDGKLVTDLSPGWPERLKSVPAETPRVAIDWNDLAAHRVDPWRSDGYGPPPAGRGGKPAVATHKSLTQVKDFRGNALMVCMR